MLVGPDAISPSCGEQKAAILPGPVEDAENHQQNESCVVTVGWISALLRKPGAAQRDAPYCSDSDDRGA